MTYSKALMDLIARLRDEHDLSVHGFAVKCGIPYTTMEKLVKGEIENPGIYAFDSIANRFEMEPYELLSQPEFKHKTFERKKDYL